MKSRREERNRRFRRNSERKLKRLLKGKLMIHLKIAIAVLTMRILILRKIQI